MEGNIVFRQGERVIYADRMYYDVANQVGTVLEAEMLTPVPEYEGLLRLKADVLQQTGEDRFFAEDAFSPPAGWASRATASSRTTSTFEDLQRPGIDPLTGQPVVDPMTGEPVVDHEQLATARNNFVYLGDVPVFYWPVLATDLTDPTFYIRRVAAEERQRLRHPGPDRLGRLPAAGHPQPAGGTDWDVEPRLPERAGLRPRHHVHLRPRRLLRALRARRPGWSTTGASRTTGSTTWARAAAASSRRRTTATGSSGSIASDLPDDFQLTAEVGWISDRNFLEEYFEREWDELKDQTTGVELKQTRDNMSWSITADARLNSSSPRPMAAPRRPLLAGPVAVGRRVHLVRAFAASATRGFGTATAPERPGRRGPFDLLPWEACRRSAATRRAVGHPAGDRLALPARPGQGRALRPGRVGPLGRRPQRRRPAAGLLAGGHPGQHADVEGRSRPSRASC